MHSMRERVYVLDKGRSKRERVCVNGLGEREIILGYG